MFFQAGKRLLILGANRYNVPSIKSAKDAGFSVMVADRNPQAAGLAYADVRLCIDLFSYDDLIRSVHEFGGVDGIVSMAEAGVIPMAELSQRLGLINISPKAARNATSKVAMRRAWDGSPYSVSFTVVNTLIEAYQGADAIGYPCLMKPDRSFGGSRGVSRIDGPTQVPEGFRFAEAGGINDSSIVIEKFITGSEYSAEILIYGDDVSVLCIGEKVKSALPYRVDLSVQYPADLTPIAKSNIYDMARFATRALGLTQGVSHIEFALNDDMPLLFELGARCGGGHTPQIAGHVSGVNEFIEYCRMACGMPPMQFHPICQKGADYRFLVYNPGIIGDIHIPEDVSRHKDIFDLGITLHPGDTIHPLHTTAHRAGFVICFGNNRVEAVKLGQWVQNKIKITYQAS